MAMTNLAPTSLQIAILRSKASGKCDNTTARELYISERTLRRHLDELARTLGVAGRLALGIEVGQRGWLENSRTGTEYLHTCCCRSENEAA